jgi:flagellar biogenesis protein FliO
MPESEEVMPDAESGRWERRGLAILQRWWRGRRGRQLRLRETLALGERRFVAVVEFERQRFLIGGSNSCMTLLAQIPPDGGEADEMGPGPERGENREEGKA